MDTTAYFHSPEIVPVISVILKMAARGKESSLAATLRDLAIIPSVPCAFEVLSPESSVHASDAVIALNLKRWKHVVWM